MNGEVVKKFLSLFPFLRCHSVLHAPLPFSLGTLDDYYLSEKLRFVPLSEYHDYYH
jgi:hypothetical protein